MEYPDEIAHLHADIIRAARHYVNQRGWAVTVGNPARCHDCHARLDSEDHAEHCDYDRLRQTVNALNEANAIPSR